MLNLPSQIRKCFRNCIENIVQINVFQVEYRLEQVFSFIYKVFNVWSCFCSKFLKRSNNSIY